MKTKDIERVLVNNIDDHIMSLRTYLADVERDYLTVNKSGYATEYEIKISKSDFKNDFKKQKHKHMKLGRGGIIRRFYFVVPEGMLTIYKIPPYAGWIEIKGKKLITRKKAPLLQARKVSPTQKEKLYRSMMYRFLKESTK